MRAIALVCLLVSSAACGGSSRPAPAAPTEAGAPETLLVSKVEGLASQVDGADCPGYAATLEAWVSAHGEEVRALAHQSKAAPSLPASEIEALETRLAAALGVVVRGAIACQEDRDAQAAFQGFSLLAMDTTSPAGSAAPASGAPATSAP